MLVRCIEDVVVNMGDGREKDVAFIKGKTYKAYRWLKPDGYDYTRTWCAKNELKDKIRHIIHSEDGKADEFFNKHFEVVFYE